jgi:hypothetical protein
MFSVILQIHTVNTPQGIPDVDFYRFALVKFSATGSIWHILVTIPLDHEETVTLQFLPDLFNENN